MNSGPAQPPHPPLPFEAWKLLLRKDCEAQEKLPAFHAMGDYVLRLLWQRGIEPNVKAIVDGASDHNPPSESN